MTTSGPALPAAAIEGGSRNPPGWEGRLVAAVLVAWVLFQLWFASPLPFALGVGVFNDTQARSIHLAFAVFLAFYLFPFRRSRGGGTAPPLFDRFLAVVAAFSAGYLYLFYASLAERPGLPTVADKVFALVGIVTLLEAVRRSLGPALVVVCAAFLGYAFLGPWLPGALAHRGASLNKAVSHYWLGTEGVFGVPVGVSVSMVFLFVLFGSILERCGAGNWFIRSSFALLGHLRGGPAKAAVLSSAATGMVSGSSIANVVTTGTFTIPLMRKVGFSPEKAGAIECASSTNGQLTPPVMGAAAFLMVEYVGVSYLEVIQAAILPAILAYIALFYITHIEAVKLGIGAMPASRPDPWRAALLGGGILFGALAAGAVVSWFAISLIRSTFGPGAVWVIPGFLFLTYILLLRWSARVPDLPEGAEIAITPPMRETLQAGAYFVVPIGVLVWCFAVDQLSPGLSAFWATLVLAVIAVTHHPLKAWFRGEARRGRWGRGWRELADGSLVGGRNMVGIGVATAAAGIVVGTVTLTGLGLRMTELIEVVSGGNLVLVLVCTALICLVLGMGLPTTANYIVVSTLMAPVIVTLAGEAGLAMPLIAVHLFVFYFGILADDTPPVGLAAYAGAAIAGGSPVRTGVQAFAYDIRTAVLPFLFVFNHELILQGIQSVPHLLLTIFGSLAGMLLFASATQRHLCGRLGLGATIGVLFLAFVFFRPGWFLDQVSPRFAVERGSEVVGILASLPPDAPVAVRIVGETIEPVDKWVMLPAAVSSSSADRIVDFGVSGAPSEGVFAIDDVLFGSPAGDLGLLFGLAITEVRVERERIAKEWLWLPAGLATVLFLIPRLRRRPDGSSPERKKCSAREKISA